MKKAIAIVLILAAGILIGRAHAQTSASQFPVFMGVTTKSQCVVTPSVTTVCIANDTGILQSVTGAPFVVVGASAITINGKTGTSFTISATATAPVVTANSTTPTVSVSVN